MRSGTKKTMLSMAGILLMVLFMTAGMGRTTFAAYIPYPSFTVEAVQTDATANSITVGWQAKDAGYYNVEIKDISLPYEQQQWVPVASGLTQNSVVIPGLVSGSEYYVRVTAVSAADPSRTDVSSVNEAKTLISTMRNVHVAEYYHFIQTVHVDWDQLRAADGYEYTFSNYKGKVINKGTLAGRTDTISINKLKTETIYTFAIRGYMQFNGQVIYTPWEKINVFEQAWVKSAVKKNGKLTISWNPVKGATGYDIYVSSNEKTGYKKVKSVGAKKRSITIKKVGKTKINKKKNWNVYVITKKKNDRSGVVYFWSSKENGRSYHYIDKSR